MKMLVRTRSVRSHLNKDIPIFSGHRMSRRTWSYSWDHWAYEWCGNALLPVLEEDS